MIVEYIRLGFGIGIGLLFLVVCLAAAGGICIIASYFIRDIIDWLRARRVAKKGE